MGKAIILKSPAEIEIMQEANQIVAETLEMLREHIYPGQSTLQLDHLAEKFSIQLGGIPAFKGYRGFPASLCVSINEQVVHGIPSKKVLLKEGDIISIDFGIKYRGFYGDAAVTIPVGTINPEKARLLKVTEESLYIGIEKARSGNRVNDISKAVQQHVEKHNFSVVRQFVGHGIGSNLHEAPEIPNYSRKERTPKLLPGMVLAIEPMVNIGTHEVTVLRDGWTVITSDKSSSAHFEHSVAITEDEPIILSKKS
ncbi:MAG: type I methionyl aminopeptidase [Proteobacteria bacterium]|nr:type I methionyl aminopeptidase [Pseudomonadota bacterium]MBU1710046.1 type I methionyl aminopeptidase [Pseudomonadota bacterium]